MFRTADDRIFALEDRCPHKGGPLSQGIVHGTSVTCPLHNWVLSLETGEAQGADDGRALTFPLRVGGRPHPDRPRSARAPADPRKSRAMSDERTRTTCPYCGVGCGVLAKARDDGGAEIKGDPDHPANFGRLCSKGFALGETLVARQPAAQADRRRRANAIGSTALDLVAARFRKAIAVHGPDSVAFYVSGQLLIEDYYVANKLMKGFIGSGNIDTNSRLCMASSVAGHRRAFGSDTVPGLYEDLELADLVVLVGSNLAWCHPVLFQRLVAAREKRGTKIVVIDPRATATSEIADMHLRVAPGADVPAVRRTSRASQGRGPRR